MNITLIKTHCLYFAVGIQIQNTTIHGAFTQLIIFFFQSRCAFFFSFFFVQARLGGETAKACHNQCS